MRLSIVIVSYNVCAFLEQCLLSVQLALEGIEGEVWVVDNASTDDSVSLVRQRFPEVRLIANRENVGFAAANNQAIRQSCGEYVLLLNPDTLVEADTFRHCLAFMDAHPEAGALGVRMLDGSGQYLPESKRGFPTPWVSFCKMMGLGVLFPRSARFNGYYMGHLDLSQTHPVDVLAGCFMFIRRSALERAGLLDEAFFMYGEDIDLSYRLQQAGFQNYYYPHTRILHYKGESTQKDFRYVRRFYEAMIIFARKHFRRGGLGLLVLLLQAAIALRAVAAFLARAAQNAWLPLLDAALMYGGLVALKDFWAHYYYKDPDYFQPSILWFNFPLYVSVWLLVLWLGGSYDRRYDLVRLLRNVGVGAVLLAAIYGFLDQAYRPSRAVLILGAIWTAAGLSLLRVLLYFIEYRSWRIGQLRRRNILIVGGPTESERAKRLLQRAEIAWELTTTLAPDQRQRLPALVRLFEADEIIFCTQDVPISDVLDTMQSLGPSIRYKTLPAGSDHIIGSSNKDRPGELYSIAPNFRLAQPESRRAKRAFDLVVCVSLLLLSPLWVLVLRSKKALAQNWLPVLLGRKTWIGYAPSAQKEPMPLLPPAVFPLAQLVSASAKTETALTEAEIQRLNFLYAKNWSLGRDAALLCKILFTAKG
ncbi:MAG: glycosyltransferase family 2 protein [Saprospiraceae bacterium]|nr:glycosyltransferase family 2 protein [Saprospiraceae bacterium]MDW8228912.1 glycosyltransferase family 2 protein [Saprospiraceae bacterium]